MLAPSKLRIAVIGAGVMGLSVGLCLIEKYGSQLELTIIADTGVMLSWGCAVQAVNLV